MVTAYLALGSNLGDRRAFLHAAAAALGRVAGVRVLAQSGIYETVPEGNAAEPLYLNAALRVETSLSARQLLDACLGIERMLGRVRSADGAKCARVIDIDLLLFGEQTIDGAGAAGAPSRPAPPSLRAHPAGRCGNSRAVPSTNRTSPWTSANPTQACGAARRRRGLSCGRSGKGPTP